MKHKNVFNCNDHNIYYKYISNALNPVILHVCGSKYNTVQAVELKTVWINKFGGGGGGNVVEMLVRH